VLLFFVKLFENVSSADSTGFSDAVVTLYHAVNTRQVFHVTNSLTVS